MPGPTADVDREIYDASKGDIETRFQQGQPVLASDLNALQQGLRWNITRGMDALAAYSTTVAPLGLRSLISFGDRNTTLAWPPVPFAEILTWAPGSMRPYVFDGNAVENDFSVMWGPCFFEGLFLDDVESRYPLVTYASTSHAITSGTVSSVAGTTITDSSKSFPDLDGAGRLHLVGELAGVGNGVARPCRVRFLTGDAAGEEYVVSAVPSSSSLTLAGPFVGTVAADDQYALLPSKVTFVAAQVETVWLCMWVEDVDSVEDPDLLEPTTGMEPSHRLRTRYWLRVLPDGATSPVSSARPLYTDAAPHTYEGRVFWAQVALITPTSTILAPADFDYTLPEDQEIVDSIAGLTASLTNEIASLASLTALFDIDHHAASGAHEQITLSGISDLPVTCNSAIAQRVDLANTGVGTLDLRSDGTIESSVGSFASLLAGGDDADSHTVRGELAHLFTGGGGGTAFTVDGDTGRVGLGGAYDATNAARLRGATRADRLGAGVDPHVSQSLKAVESDLSSTVTLGSAHLGTSAGASTPRVVVDPVVLNQGGPALTTYTLLLESFADGGNGARLYLRHYASTGLTVPVCVINAWWDEPSLVWRGDPGGGATHAVRYVFSTVFSIEYFDSDVGVPWAEAAWQPATVTMQGTTGVVTIIGPVKSTTTAVIHGRIGTGGPTPILLGGYQVDTPTYDGTDVVVPFDAVMADNTYTIVPHGEVYRIRIIARSATGVTFRALSWADGSTINMAGLVEYIDFAIFGELS